MSNKVSTLTRCAAFANIANLFKLCGISSMLHFQSSPEYSDAVADSEDLPWMQWDEFNDFFKSTLIEPKSNRVDTLKSLFGQSKEDFRLWLTLKDPTKHLLIVLIPSSNNRDLAFMLYEDASLKHCLLSFFYNENVLNGAVYNIKKGYTRQDLKSLYSLFELAMNREVHLNEATQPSNVSQTELVNKDVAMRFRKKNTEMTLSEWSTLLESLPTKGAYKFRTGALRRKMTKNNKGTHLIWLNLNDAGTKKIQITFQSTNVFLSNTFSKNALILERPKNDDRFDLMYVYETKDTSDKNILMQFKISKGGEFAELVFVKSGQTITGSELLGLLDQFTKSLGIHTILIQDDAYAPLYKDKKIPLRILRPLTHPDRKTWYQSYGFELYPCKEIEDEKFISKNHPDTTHSHTYNQDLALYNKSIDKICSMEVHDLLSVSKKIQKKTLSKLLKKYKEKDTGDKNTTLSALLTQVFHKTKDPSDTVRKKAQKRMYRFYKHFLKEPFAPKAQKSGLNKEFQEAVSVLHGYRLFVKKTQKTPVIIETKKTKKTNKSYNI